MGDRHAGHPGGPAGRGGALAERPHGGRRFVAVALVACLALSVLGALAGLAFATTRGEREHTADAVVLLRPLEGNAFNPSSTGSDLINMETEAQLVNSGVVTQLTAERLGAPEEAGEIRSGLVSTVPPNTQLVEITASGATDQEAVDRAQALAETFLAFRADRSESDVFVRGARLREEIRAGEERRRKLVSGLAEAPPNSPRRVVRQEQISEITIQLGEFRVQLAELEAASQDPGQVVTSASASSPGLLSSPLLLALAGAALGLVAGLLLVGVRRRLDERVHGPQDLADAGVPVLGRLPADADERPRAVGGLRAAVLAAEPARPLVLGVAAGAAPDRDDALAATADLTGELGLSLRRSGLVVAVLDLAAGPERALRGAPGTLDGPLLPLSGLLDAGPAVPEVLARRRAEGLPLAVVNDLSEERLADRVSSAEMVALLAALRGAAEAVVVDIGSLADTSAQSLVGAVDSVVLTVREGSATFAQLEATLNRLPVIGARLAGLVCVAGGRGQRRGRLSAASRRTRASEGPRAASGAEAMLPRSEGQGSEPSTADLSEEPR